jgi:hypothetical protein
MKKINAFTVREQSSPAPDEAPKVSVPKARNCIALHTFEGLDLDNITSITPRQDYSGVHGDELLDYGVAAVKIAKLGGRFSRPVFLELDKRFKAGKKSKDHFLGFKSIDALCKHIGISRKHFYNLINDNLSGRKPLSSVEQMAKDEARVKREAAKADREAKRRVEKERLSREAEELKAARENNKKMQQSLDRNDDAIARARQEAAEEVIRNATTAAAQNQNEKRPEGLSPEPRTGRDVYYFTIGAGSVKGLELGSPGSIVKILFHVLDGQTNGRSDARDILRDVHLGVERRLNKLTPPTAEPPGPEPHVADESPEAEQARLRVESGVRWTQAETLTP